jgi:hypothetical protein
MFGSFVIGAPLDSIGGRAQRALSRKLGRDLRGKARSAPSFLGNCACSAAAATLAASSSAASGAGGAGDGRAHAQVERLDAAGEARAIERPLAVRWPSRCSRSAARRGRSAASAVVVAR